MNLEATWPPVLAFLLLSACSPENEFQGIRLDTLAVVAGDYDRMEEILLREIIAYQLYEGYIQGPVYDDTVDPDMITLKEEGLFRNPDELALYGGVFVNSGARGLGQYRYSSLEDDNDLVADPQVIANVTKYVQDGGVLVATDWAYDLVEECFPDAITFVGDEAVGDEAVFDDAQKGIRGQVSGRILDSQTEEDLGVPVVAIDYDFTYWSVIKSVAPTTQVYVEGDIVYRASEAEGEVTMADSPLLVAFGSGLGRVVFSTFHWRVQTPGVADPLFLAVVEGLQPGNAETGETGGQ